MNEPAYTEPIKMAQAIYSLSVGGSEVLAWRIAKALNVLRGYTCSVYGVQGDGPLGDALAVDGIPTKAFYRTRKFDWRLVADLARQIRRDKVQLVHTHHLGQLLFAGVAARLAGARVVHTEHECYTLSRVRLQRLLRILSGVADKVTAVAEPVTEFLALRVGIPREKLQTIPNGVHIPTFQTARAAKCAETGWNHNHIIIGCAARLEPVKNHAVLLNAFRRVRSRVSRARLLLIGDGSLRAALGEMAESLGLSDAVRFLGSRRDIPGLLANCDIVVLPSLNEGLPLSILEAMAASKPVIATSVGCLPELVQQGVTGMLVPPRDEDALVEALLDLAMDHQKRRKLGTRAAEVVRRCYNFDHVLERYDEIYRTVLALRQS